MKHFVLLFLVMGALLTSSCRTGVILRETPLGISETRRVIVTVIGEARAVSDNGREIFSKFYDKKNNFIGRLEMANERYYTLVTVLGDRKPYDIQVEVMLEERAENGKFVFTESLDKRARPIAEQIKKALNQSLGTRNVIDDFRSF